MLESKKVAKRIIILSFLTTILFSFSICVEAVEYSNLNPPLGVLWEYKLENVCSSFETSNESIYAACSQIHAFNASTGQIIWRYNASGSTIHFSNNTIYTGDTLICALNSTNGILEWSHDINGTLDVISVKNGVVYAITKKPASIFAINQTSGKKLWVYNSDFDNIYSQSIHSNIIVLITETSEDNLLNIYDNFSIQIINISDGVQLWKWNNKSIVINNVLFSNDTIMVITSIQNKPKFNIFQQNVIIYGVNTSNAEINWNVPISNVLGPMIVDKSVLYVRVQDRVKSFNLVTGNVNWEQKIQNPKDIATKNKSIYVNSKNKLYSLNEHGKLNWVFQTRDTYKIFNTSSLRIEDMEYDAFRVHFLDNTVYLFSKNNYLYNLNNLGMLNWELKLKDPSSKGQFINNNGMLYIIGDTIQIVNQNGTRIQEIDGGGRFIGIINDTMFLYTKERTITALSSEKKVGPYAVKLAESAIRASEEKTNTTHAQEMYIRAKDALLQEEYSNAIRYANKAKESLILPYISAAESSISRSKFLFLDNTKHEKKLENAKTAYINDDFPNAINQAIAAKESADNAIKTILIQYISIAFILILTIILFYNFGLLKGYIAIAKFIPFSLILLCIVSTLIWIYLAFSSINLTALLLSQKPAIPFFGLFYGSLLVLPFIFNIFYDSVPIKIFRYIFLFFHFLMFIPAIFFIVFTFTYFFMVRHMHQTGEFNSNILTFFLHMFDPMRDFVLLVAISIFLSLLIFIVYIFTQYRTTWTLASKANKCRKQGDIIKAIELYTEELDILKKMDGFFIKIDPFHKLSILSCNIELCKYYYLIGDYDNTVKILQNIRDFDDETIDAIYKGQIDIFRLTVTLEPQTDIFKTDILGKLYSIERYIINPKIFHGLKIEHVLITGLLLVFVFYQFLLLSADYTDTLLIQQPYPKLGQFGIWIGFFSLFIFSTIFLLHNVLKIKDGYSENISYLFSSEQSNDIVHKHDKFKILYKNLSFSLLLICILYALQSSKWFGNDMLHLSNTLGILFILINIIIPIIVLIYTILILSFFKNFVKAVYDFTKTDHDFIFHFNILPFINIIFCLFTFITSFTLILTSIEGGLYDFWKVLPPFFIAIMLFILMIRWISHEFSIGSSKLIGDIYYQEKMYEEACQYYEKTDKYIKNTLYRLFSFMSNSFYSNLYIVYGDAKFRLGNNKCSLVLFEKSLIFIEEGGMTSDLWRIHYKIGLICEKEDKLDEAYKNYIKSIKVIENLRELVKVPERRVGFFENKIDVYTSMVMLCLKQNNVRKAFEYVERSKSRVFVDMLLNKDLRTDDVDADLLEQKKQLLSKLHELKNKMDINKSTFNNRSLLSKSVDRRKLHDEKKQVENQYSDVLKSILEQNPEYGSLFESYTLPVSEIQSIVKSLDAVLIEYFIVTNKIIIFVVDGDSISHIEVDDDFEDLKEYARYFRSGVENIEEFNISMLKKISKKLYNSLFKPIENFIEKDKNVYIIPHDFLHLIPFNALFDGSQYLIEKYTIAYCPSSTVLKFCIDKDKNPKKSCISIGNPTHDLEFTELEARNVSGLFYPSLHLIGDEATKERVIENCNNYNILHMACHGYFNSDQPLDSMLQLADGKGLHVDEIFEMKLNNSSLVILSACQTALSKISTGDEVVGLTRAFIFAGTPALVSTLWNVDDEKTSELVKDFCFRFKECGRAESLRQAQLDLINGEETQYQHPYYWAAFEMMGSLS